MVVRVVDNKRLEMTNDEWTMYQKIVKSYTTQTNKGEDLFVDLFEVDNDGIIIFLKPPSKRQSTMEVFLFLMSLFQHQHIRLMRNAVSDIVSQMTEKMHELDKKMQKLSEEKKDK
ncbi:MAG TPA: hypothetical protein VII94_01555 [Candidatus Saccharimonadales bacterium]